MLPDARGGEQQLLETALLLAVRHAERPISDLHKLGPNSQRSADPVILRVTPHDELVVVDVEPDAAYRFLTALIPTTTEDGYLARGVPGLRIIRQGRDVELRLFGKDRMLNSARALVRGVPVPKWREVLKFIDENRSNIPDDPRIDRSPQSSSREVKRIAEYTKCPGPIGFGSAMLRRFGLLADADHVDIWPTSDTTVNIEIDRGRGVCAVARALQHPLAGIVDSRFIIDEPLRPTDTRVTVIDTAPDPGVSRRFPSAEPLDRPRLALRTMYAVSSRVDSRSASGAEGER
ncbi:hypothetical protein FNH05_04910 [Amycolatopsis rhizosphaerae]|uniref:Uncharacterized protein n=1 Tax=Amycolatopsis rhizosphaerae TaxID=2053003 RepID=A0A558DGG9_9PSEU|nr:hypothetical protein [Amycolatopsis rhizosphaerae]TVT60120.1 hypothetical protein FNH05_04910 [Amycolatopsis rhizosphaerae]